MSKSYLNKVELKDGQIVLFHRTASSRRPVYHMRIHVRGMRDVNGTKVTYWQSTTNESDLEEAKRVALDKYDELRLLVKDKRPVIELTWREMYGLWWQAKRVKLDARFAAKGRVGQTMRIPWFEKQSGRYWLAYFGDVKLGDLTQSFIESYWTWRLTYWKLATDAEKREFSNYALVPSKKTLDMEQSSLREIFGWANAHRHITFMPVVENPYAKQGIAPKRRASFEVRDFAKLCNYMTRWVEGRGDNDVRVNARHLYQRQLLQIYVHWLAYTGMRTGEVLKLKHRDVRKRRTDEGEIEILRINVSPDTKTGKRMVRSQPELLRWYKLLLEMKESGKADDWVFSDRFGKKNDGFYKTITKLFDEAGVLYDADGEKRTAYSLRHYYAEQRLIELGTNARAYDMIGTNMGTGRQYLEAHYVRKGMMMDEDMLVGSSSERRTYSTGKTELERSRRAMRS